TSSGLLMNGFSYDRYWSSQIRCPCKAGECTKIAAAARTTQWSRPALSKRTIVVFRDEVGDDLEDRSSNRSSAGLTSGIETRIGAFSKTQERPFLCQRACPS